MNVDSDFAAIVDPLRELMPDVDIVEYEELLGNITEGSGHERGLLAHVASGRG